MKKILFANTSIYLSEKSLPCISITLAHEDHFHERAKISNEIFPARFLMVTTERGFCTVTFEAFAADKFVKFDEFNEKLQENTK